jgi:hypothetical protein
MEWFEPQTILMMNGLGHTSVREGTTVTTAIGKTLTEYSDIKHQRTTAA